MTHITRVWDLPTRIFHWSLLVLVVFMVITAKIGGNAMIWHFRGGYTVLALLLFRLVWGFMGGHWSRFASFFYTPSTVLGYLRGLGMPEHSAGHNPLGASSVFAMLAFLLAQVGTGLFADDDIANSGPLSKFASSSTVNLLTGYHKGVGKYVLFTLILLHVVAILFYLHKKKENLIRPMLHGNKELAHVLPHSRDDAGSRALALVVLIVCAVFVATMIQLAG
jgi:cytochrome b